MTAVTRTEEAATIVRIYLTFTGFFPFLLKLSSTRRYFNATREQILITLLSKYEMLVCVIAANLVRNKVVADNEASSVRRLAGKSNHCDEAIGTWPIGLA